MVPLETLAQHLLALLAVWTLALAAGLPLALLLRLPLGLAGAACLGVAYWAASLYLFQFPHGLDIALLAAACGFALALLRQRALLAAWYRRLRDRASLILIVGCASFATLLFTNYVPPGMDGVMHTAGGRAIAAHRGLPTTYAPFLPERRFPAVNTGLPTLVGAAVRLGCAPAAMMLAAEQFTFSLFVLAGYLLLRLAVPRTPAALFAIFAVWTSRNAQETLGWGGVPTITSLAIGLFACRLLIDVARRPSYRAAIPLGIIVASLPLIHGVGAGVWAYTFGPMSVLVGLGLARRFWPAVGTLAVAAGIGGGVLGCYTFAARSQMHQLDYTWTHKFQEDFAPKGTPAELLLTVPAYINNFSGSVGIWAGVAALGVLLWRRQFAAFAVVAATALLLCIVVANSRFWVLPLSMLLYPERAVYWGTPLAAVALALAWRSLPPQIQASRLVIVALCAAAIPFAVARHNHGYQRIVFLDPAKMSAEEWQALVWSRQHLDPRTDYVDTQYRTAGSYLPAVAGIGIVPTGWHTHYFVGAQEQGNQREVTHRFITAADRDAIAPFGEVVFRNSAVTIVRQKPPQTAATAWPGH